MLLYSNTCALSKISVRDNNFRTDMEKTYWYISNFVFLTKSQVWIRKNVSFCRFRQIILQVDVKHVSICNFISFRVINSVSAQNIFFLSDHISIQYTCTCTSNLQSTLVQGNIIFHIYHLMVPKHI